MHQFLLQVTLSISEESFEFNSASRVGKIYHKRRENHLGIKIFLQHRSVHGARGKGEKHLIRDMNAPKQKTILSTLGATQMLDTRIFKRSINHNYIDKHTFSEGI